MKLLCVGIVLLGVSCLAGADFTLYGTEHLDVITSHTTGILFDSSTVDVLEGGYVDVVYINDDATLNVLRYRYGGSGANSRAAFAYNNSTVVVSGGQLGTGRWDGLYVYDNSSTIISSGRITGVDLYDTSNLTISGGSIDERLDTHGNSQVNISGGSVGYYCCGYGLRAYDTSHVNISGGNIERLRAYDTSYVDMSGGNIESLNAYNLKLDGPERVNITDGIVENLNAYIVLDGNGYLSYIDDFLPSDLISYGVHITGGTVSFVPHFEVSGSSQLDVSGGSIQTLTLRSSMVNITGGNVDMLKAESSSTAALSGGSIDRLEADRGCTVMIHGYDFVASAGASIVGNEVIDRGLLRGKWLDDTSFVILITGYSGIQLSMEPIEPPDPEPYCTASIPGDLNNDCKVDLADLAILVSNWLKCNIEPQTACWE